MQKNEIIELKIEDIGIDGEGIGKYEGMTFFVKDAVIGDFIKARITKLKKNYGYARVEEILMPSEFRVEPECELHKRCGGCQIQALNYRKQLWFKEKKVRGNLTRIGGFDAAFIDKVMRPVVGMEYPYRYRNKAQFPIGRDKEGKIIAGFYASRTHNIIPVTDCKLGVKENRSVLDAIISYMEEVHIEPYNETTGKGVVRHVLVRYGFTTKEIMVCVIINGRKLPAQEKLIEKLCKLEGMTSISINSNMKNTNVILGDVTETIWGQAYITDYIHLRKCGEEQSCKRSGEQTADGKGMSVKIQNEAGGFEQMGSMEAVQNEAVQNEAVQNKAVQNEAVQNEAVQNKEREFELTDTAIAYRISPQSFYQVNPVQTEKLYSLALEYAGLTGKETVWDLYCGIGTISLFLAQKAGKVYGVEIVPQAIEDAKNNAKLNGISNAEFFVGKAEEVLPEFYERESRKARSARNFSAVEDNYSNEENAGMDAGENARKAADMLHPDVIVVDPPRKGCDEKCLETMLQMCPERIVYVSCDSATLARDLRILCDGGYEIKKVRAVDQFANTTHVESVILMQYCGKREK